MSDLHNAIMNIPCVAPKDANINQALSYKVGHRDARHAAAELALATHAGAAAEPVACKREPSLHGGFICDGVDCYRCTALTSAPAEPDEMLRLHDAADTLYEQGWIWDGDQWQRPPAETPPAAGAIDAREQGPVAAWINYPVKVVNNEFGGHGEPELAFKRAAYGYDWAKAEPLYRRAASPEEAPPAAGAAQAVDIEDVLGKQVWFDRKDVKRVIAAIFSSYGIPKGPFGMRERLLRSALAATPAPETKGGPK